MLSKSPAPNWGTAPFCAITGRGVDDDGWFSNRQVLSGHDPVAWVSMAGVRLLATSAGWTSPEEAETLRAEVLDLTSALDEAVREISELRKQVGFVEGLAQSGFEVSRRTGRPPKRAEETEIRREIKEKVGS